MFIDHGSETYRGLPSKIGGRKVSYVSDTYDKTWGSGARANGERCLAWG